MNDNDFSSEDESRVKKRLKSRNSRWDDDPIVFVEPEIVFPTEMELTEEFSEQIKALQSYGLDPDSPIFKFVKKLSSGENRQTAGRSAYETLQTVSSNPVVAATVLDIVSILAKDPDSSVRYEIMEFLPHMALFLSKETANPALKTLIYSHILPVITEVLSDPNQQVIQMVGKALTTLVEHFLINGEYIESVWPIIKGRVRQYPSVESYTGILELMSKVAPWISPDVIVRLFVPVLVRIRKTPEFFVREFCASIFGEICTVVGPEVTESSLLPSFLKLCKDNIWGVRKMCAETFMAVSCSVSLETRKKQLAPAFALLLSDSMRWVQLAAYEALGPFITTFADPCLTTLVHNDQGVLVLKSRTGFEYKLKNPKLSLAFRMIRERRGKNNPEPMCGKGSIESKEEELNDEEGGKSQEDGELKFYNQFNFWREPVLNIELDDEITTLPDSPLNNDIDNCLDDNEQLVNALKELKIWNDPQENEESILEAVNIPLIDDFKLSMHTPLKKQDIVPEDLIRHFVSMTDPKQDKSSDLAWQCAYYLPAVAMTLGPDNWELLKVAYETLAADRQWRIRRIVASSIYELALMIGEDAASQDLVPVFNGFIKDLDEVRIGALNHLANFLKLLRPAVRNSFLPRLAEFLMTDYDGNWRFREELGAQLVQALGLFSPSDTCHHLTPVAVSLLLDKVAYVRKVALQLVTELVNHVSIDVGLLRGLLAELAAQFAHSFRWNRRQTFALLCARILSEHVLSEEMFARDLLPHLLDLSWDRVPNVRLSVAKVLALHAMACSYFADPMSPHHEVLMAVLKRLQGDKDRDVRYFASLPPKDLSSPIQDESILTESDWLRET